MKQGEPNVPTWQEFLVKDLPSGSRIGIDPSLISVDDAKTISIELQKVHSTLVPIESGNLVDQVWGNERPQRPQKPVFVLDEKYSGRSAIDKIKELRAELKKKGDHVKGVVANMLDEVAWLLNLRGSDVPYNPVFFAFALVLMDKTILYVNESQLEENAKKYIGKDVELRPYESFYDDLRQLGSGLKEGDKIFLSRRASLAVQEALGGSSKVFVDRSIIIDQRVSRMRQRFRDSVIVTFVMELPWLAISLGSRTIAKGRKRSEELDKFRARDKEFRGPSFTTISSTGANGAIIHYSPNPDGCPNIDPSLMYLCDSGAQFTDGTTDVTRTWHFQKPDEEQIRAFTRVLQGHIAIDRAVFAAGTTGYQLDALARRPLWGEGWDFRHGVGHGVGHFLNVHEPPQGISTRVVHNETSLKDGMVISNEPGYYKDGSWGIRIENLVVVRKAKTPNSFGSKGYLCFERLTFCPFREEWINDYHDETLAKVGPILKNLGDERGYAWLKKECEARV
ncbi:hypothetical protein IEQ34_026137 [Dendrobium chrysotoxum]|uniref:Uncharacterized protein n=1 Tax=Dendrobium chrysotoxum TaxID=161865 RepID=A0AAV7FNC5_DENCH|nr:hypothetical protein IEQ34_026137 [Dendrobium chrysotoxum]